jgi:outer membrane protein OmpA-like peptidoglycan-associated protein
VAGRYGAPIVVNFDRYETRLDAAQRSRLAEIAGALAPCPELGLTISGYADSRGAPGLNATLARERANSAARYVEGRGVARSRLKVDSFGGGSPLAGNETDEGRARNRRVELIIRKLP